MSEAAVGCDRWWKAKCSLSPERGDWIQSPRSSGRAPVAALQWPRALRGAWSMTPSVFSPLGQERGRRRCGRGAGGARKARRRDAFRRRGS